MFTKAFWKGTAERAVRTFAQALIAVFGTEATGLLAVDWPGALSAAGMAAVISVLMSLAASGIGGDGPGITEEPRYDAKHDDE